MQRKTEQPFTLVELNSKVKMAIRRAMPDTYWLQAELSEVSPSSSGHCYLEFIQKDERNDALLAKARGVIWRTTYRQLKVSFERETGQSFVSGLKVLVNVKVEFHELYGYQLSVLGIDPTYTLGDIARRRREILRQLERDGVVKLNKMLPMPQLPQRIAVVSSPTAAGYEDFCKQLATNNFGFVFYTKLFPAVMQGDAVEASIIEALDSINQVAQHYDVVVIIRGGGAVSDLSGFDTYNLAFNCAQFPLPIITGIGHERDDTVIDMVAHTRVKTPTAAAEFLINHIYQSASRLQEIREYINKVVPQMLNREKERLDKLLIRIPSLVRMRLQSEHFRNERITKRMQMAWQTRLVKEEYRLKVMPRISIALQSTLQKERHKLDLLEQKVKASSPEILLKKGYSITFKDGKAITDPRQLQVGDEVTTHLSKGQFRSKVLNHE